jgi:glycosyltransferase involved in cell wall biosynthesis
MIEVVIDPIIFHLQAKGGITRIYHQILPRLCQLDAEANVVLLVDERLQYSDFFPEAECIQQTRYPRAGAGWRWRPARLRQWLARQLTLARWRRTLGDTCGKIWHSTYFTQPPDWRGYHVTAVYDLIYWQFPDLHNQPEDEAFRQRQRASIQAADIVLTISETVRHDVLDRFHVPPERVITTPLAATADFRTLSEAQFSLALPTKKPFILYVGNRGHRKNFPVLVKAYSAWDRRNDVALLAVGGKPWTPAEMHMLEVLGIESNVHLLPDIGDDLLCELYNRAAAFVYPSLYEGFGIPLLEAMQCGCPVIASRIPTSLEVAGDVPVYFEATDIDALIQALETALAEGRHAPRVQAGLIRAQQFSWDKTARQTLAVYKGLIERILS